MVAVIDPCDHYACLLDGCKRVKAAKMRSTTERALFDRLHLARQVQGSFTGDVERGDKLKCAFCSEAYDKFEQLAGHVQTVHYGRKSKEKKMDTSYMPSAPEANDESSYGEFLRAGDLKKSTKVKIVGVRDLGESNFQKGVNQFGLDVTLNGKARTISVNEGSPNHRILFENLGKKWIGKTIVIESRTSKRFKNAFIAITDAR